MKTTLIFLLVNLLLVGVVAVAADALIIEARDQRFDFTPHYVGGRAVWQGENPYTPAVTERIQQRMFGRALPLEADQQNMAYPAYASVVLAPVVALPVHTAIAVWMALQFVAVLWTPVVWLHILDWQPPAWMVGVLVLAFLFVFRYPMDLFVLAQFSGTVLLALSVGFWLLLKGRDLAAGVVLVLAAIPPTTGLPVALAILVGMRRWRGLAAFVGTLAALTLVSFALIGNWIPDYLDILTAYSGYAEVTWGVESFGWPVAALLVAGAAWLLWRTWRRPTHDHLLDLVVTAFIMALLLIPQTGEYYLVLLIPPLMACLRQATPLRWVVRLSCLLVVVSPWLYPRGAGMTAPALVLPVQVLLTWFIARLPMRGYYWRPAPESQRSSDPPHG